MLETIRNKCQHKRWTNLFSISTPELFSFAHDYGREVMRSHKIRGSGDENDLFFKAGELNARMSGLFLMGLFSTGDLPLERT